MQIYADVLERPISVPDEEQASAKGAAIHAAVAAGVYPDIHAAAKRMATKSKKVYRPNRKSTKAYEPIYRDYVQLHDYFGRTNAALMKGLASRVRNGGSL